jgi:ferritin-like metal-binding protein YciE
MPEMSDPQQLFVHKLGTLLKTEKTILQLLPKMAKETTDHELSARFEHHRKETEQQVKNLERVFDALGRKPQTKPAPVIDGMKTEHNEFVQKQKPEPHILDAFLAGAAAATEHHEIAAYEGLITMANAMRQEDIVALLQENLEQEQHTLEEAKAATQKLAQRNAQLARV